MWDKKARSKIIGKIRGNPAPKGDGGAGGGNLNFVDFCAALDEMWLREDGRCTGL